ncbi:MAG TPA: hypothetical protein VG165_15310 [Solirubrobacteraceae bacterium]|nr:hypothetical protein [Solirubrobacteraceae bacterium]
MGTLIVGETSNAQLDALNTRAQAIQRPEGELAVTLTPAVPSRSFWPAWKA